VVFVGKRLFEKLCKNHLTGKAREKLKKQWKEQRQGTLISIVLREPNQWNAKKLLQKLKRVAVLKGVEVIEVNPAYTSVIGMLKYAPQLSTDKDVAGAYVIGRRALGYKEDMPENYERLLKDKAYLEFALKRYEEREKELVELIEKESDEYKRNTLKGELRSVENAKKLLTNLIQSLQSEPSGCEGAYGRNPERGRIAKTTLKPILVEEVWDRVRSRLVPLEAGGTVPK